jgi:hypothetical protein
MMPSADGTMMMPIPYLFRQQSVSPIGFGWQKVHTLERENVALRRQVTQLQHSLGIVNPPTSPSVGGKNIVDAPLVGGVLTFTLTENDEEDDDEKKE